ncbi:MAG: hypothetical protein Q9216_002016 [Gyalolechia sp. 2 TL-2023]
MKYGNDFIDLKERDKYGRNYLYRMLLYFNPSPATSTEVGNNLSENIKLLLAHGANLETRDPDSFSCLHLLLRNYSRRFFDPLSRSQRAQMLVDALSLLIRKGADVHAVDNDGFSVTELAHHLRAGGPWEDALEEAGWDVEQVYMEDHGKGWKVSDDIFSPEENSSRHRGHYQRSPGPYHNLATNEMLYRVHELNLMFPKESTRSDVRFEDINDKSSDKKEYDSQSDMPKHKSDHAENHDNATEEASDSDSDEEMGGVSIFTDK